MDHYSLLNSDGTNFKPSEGVVNYIVSNKNIDTFLRSDRDSSKSLIIGQKGSGKSILIALKSYNDRTRDRDKNLNKFFIPEEGTEKIQLDDQLSSRDISKNVKYTDWNKIFNVTIYYYLLSKLKNQLIIYNVLSEKNFDKLDFHDLFNPLRLDSTKLSFGSILYGCIKNRGIIYRDCGSFIASARQIIRIYLTYRDVSVYLDNIDQTLFQALGKDETGENSMYSDIDLNEFVLSNTAYEYSDNVVKAWLNCHIGYYLTIYEINEIDNRLNVFSTYRLEAYEYMSRHSNIKNKPQLRDIACLIEYSESDYKKIYQKLLDFAKITDNKLANVGLSELPHEWVKKSHRNIESLWSFIKRHTFGNPREITLQIKVLQDAIANAEGTAVSGQNIVREFKKAVSEKVLRNIVQDLYAETLPFFPIKQIRNFYKKNRANWINSDDIENDNDRALILILYRLGLVGVIKRERESYVQIFLKKNVYFTNEDTQLRESKYYLFHPTLDHLLLMDNDNDDFYYPYGIIGNGKKFYFLREKDYYLPQKMAENASNHFEVFYLSNASFERCRKISELVLSYWNPMIIDYTQTNRKRAWIQVLGQEIRTTQRPGLRKKVTEANIGALNKNYELRIIIALSALAGLIESHEILKAEFPQNTFREITFFSDIRGEGCRLERYMECLSDFELDIINQCIEKFSHKIQNESRNDSSKQRIKDKIDEMNAILSNYKK